jgi:BirA family biotin operon repressor/biotin-[acetyl-CoA-carboxylase] ligase
VLDAETIRAGLSEETLKRVASLEIFTEIVSTNSYLMDNPGPAAGKFHIAITTNQTGGRGRQGKAWISPPGSGLCLSMAYTFADQTNDLAALTLAIGLGAIRGLQDAGVHDVFVKWPNDLIARGGKLGGILTEAKIHADGSVTVVTGLGLNLDLATGLDLVGADGYALPAVDLANHAADMPMPDVLSSHLISGIDAAVSRFQGSGFALFANEWANYDWLRDRELVIDTLLEKISGTGAGIAPDGALLVNTGVAGLQRVTSGTVVTRGKTKHWRVDS